MNAGYSELDLGDQGSPWWQSKKEKILDGASIRDFPSPVLVAIHHKSKRAYGPTDNEPPTSDRQPYCLQYATKITEDIVKYIQKECKLQGKLCTGVLIKCREGQKKNKRCGGTQFEDLNLS